MSPAQVFFTTDVTPEAVVAAYDALGITLPGRVAVKVHSGEAGNQNFIRPEFLKAAIDHVGGVVVESNTAYPTGKRHTARRHWETMAAHGWTAVAQVDILDEDGTVSWPVPGGRRLKRDIVGSHLPTYDSLLVLSHFKGHPMGGFGGALKNIAIGLASPRGKMAIHGAGSPWKLFFADQDGFLDAMADAAKAIADHFAGKMAFVNVMANLSVDCDCMAKAQPPAMADVGILASLDPVALDQACVDLLYASTDPGAAALIARIEAKHGWRTLDSAAALGVGTRAYELVKLGVSNC